MLRIVAIVPWTDIRPGDSPFALALEGVRAPRVSLIMNGVIIVAVLSCMNSGIYVCSRVLVALAEKVERPALLVTHDSRGVPPRPILIARLSGSLAVLETVLSAERLFAMRG